MNLRKMERTDLSFLLIVRNDERTRNQLENNSVFTITDCESWFDRTKPEWFIVEVDGVSVGYIRTNGDQVGVDIHPDHRNKGYATNAYKLYLKNKTFASLWVFADNPAKSIYRKLGFLETGNKTTVRNRDYIEMEYKRLKIGINLVGVSYNDGQHGRYRNYADAIDGFFTNVVTPLREKGHDVYFYIHSYDNIKRDEILNTYIPVKKFTFVNPSLNTFGGGDKLSNGMKVISLSYISSLQQLLGEDLDLVISTRFDISFYKNPFEEYQYDFSKCNFLWREPEFTHIPIVNDTFIVFPHSMTQNLINAITEMETNPPHGVGVAMHNIYVPMVNQVGKENVQWVCDEFKTAVQNTLYRLTRHE